MVIITPQGIGIAPLTRPFTEGDVLADGEFLFDGDPTGLVLADNERSLREPMTPTWAITPRGAGEPPGFRRVRVGWPLEAGETFTVTDDPAGKVLHSNLTQLRTETAPQRAARETRAQTALNAEALMRPALEALLEAEALQPDGLQEAKDWAALRNAARGGA